MTGSRKTIIVAALGLLFLACALAVPAQAAKSNSGATTKYASLVVDAVSGRVLHDANGDERAYPASLTKMMTLFMVFEALRDGRLTLGQPLPVSVRATRQPPSKLDLKAGDNISVRDAILALVTKSANDVAVVVAEALAGSETEFALRMTARARQLGMERTTFRNASGLPHRGQLSTARDMATLAMVLLRDFPDEYAYFSTTSFTFRGVTHRNHNELLTSYEGADGIKTGYIRASGFNLVTSVQRGNTRLIGVVFGGKSSGERNRHMTDLLNGAFRKLDGGTVYADKPAPSFATGLKAPPLPNSGSAGNGDWAVQVGAFYEFGTALDAARKAVSRLPSLLADGTVKVVPLEGRGRTLYRARIVNITRNQAYRACSLLKQAKQGCMEVRMPGGVQVADASGE